jgi:hypothetical protein
LTEQEPLDQEVINMKKVMAIFALAIIGSALIGCGPKEEPKATGTDTTAGKMDEKTGGTQTPTDK